MSEVSIARKNPKPRRREGAETKTYWFSASQRLRGPWLSKLRLVDSGLHDCVFEVALQLRRRRLHQDDVDHLFLRVDIDVRAVGAGPPERPLRLPEIRRDRILHHLHAKAESHPTRRAPELSVDEIAGVIGRH